MDNGTSISAFVGDFLSTQSAVNLHIIALAFIVVAGFLGGMLAKKLKQPLLLGYILAGVGAGFLFKNTTQDVGSINTALESLANIGVALLLFSMGMEFKMDDLKQIKKIATWGTILQVFATMFAAAGIAWFMDRKYGMFSSSVTAELLFGICFVSTSTAVILKTLSSRGQMGTLSSQVMIGMSIVQDLTVIPLFLIVSKAGNLSSGFLSAMVPIGWGAVFMVVMLTLGTRWLPKAVSGMARVNVKELFLLAVTAIALLSGLVADWMQLSFSFGAFLAGIALSGSKYTQKAISEIMPVRDLFAMLFFVSIGMMLDVSYLKEHVLLVVVLMLATSFSRTIVLALVTWFNGYRNVIPFAMLFGMIPTSEIAFITIQLGKDGGFFSQDVYSCVLCVVVLSMLLGPVMDALTSPVYGFVKKTFLKDGIMSNIKITLPTYTGHVIIAGGGGLGRAVAKNLRGKGYDIQTILLEPHYVNHDLAVKEGLTCKPGDPKQLNVLLDAGIDRADMLLALSGDFAENRAVIEAAKIANPLIHIITFAEAADDRNELQNMEVYDVLQPEFEVSLEVTRRVLQQRLKSPLDVQNQLDYIRIKSNEDLVNGLSPDRYPTTFRTLNGLLQLSWMQIKEKSWMCGRDIADCNIRSKTGVSVVGILRGDKPIVTNPRADYVLEAGDILALIGTEKQYDDFEEWSGTELAATPAAAEEQTQLTPP